MIDLYYWPTPNGHKVTLFLEETEAAYRLIPVDIDKGDQFEAAFLRIAPNNRIPAIVDHEPADGGEPISVFESGAILLYLADKLGRFLPSTIRARVEVTEWLCWQIANLGPMAGQNHHFGFYAREKIPYAINRYVNETSRLYAVLNKRLTDREYIAGTYSVADMACYPWIVRHERQRQDLDDYPHVKRWFGAITARPATARAYARGDGLRRDEPLSEEARRILFGQSAASVR